MVYRLILPNWATKKFPNLKRVVEGEFSEQELQEFNKKYYNIYFLPNFPSEYHPNVTVDGSHIDTFNFVFVDMDLKDGFYPDKTAFIDAIHTAGLEPTFMVDSGNGVHAYWQVDDLDAINYLRLQRRLMRKFHTDEAVGQIFQLMRVPGTLNTKLEDNFKPCEYVFQSDKNYTCEDLDKVLLPISHADEEYCQMHYNKTYQTNKEAIVVDDKLPLKFGKLLRENQEVRDIWSGNTDDRSKADFRLGHLLWSNGFTKDEARSVLVNTAKALSRAPVHRISYADNIIDKIKEYELTENKQQVNLSYSVKDILARGDSTLKGTRFPCHDYLDNTYHGFRLGQVIGLVAGSGVGKTAMALNMFYGFVKANPNYIHFFIPLEQPANEIADRWRSMCGDEVHLHDKVHVMSNYGDDGLFRHLSMGEIEEYLLKFQADNQKIGCVVIDHIGALKKKSVNGENQGIMDICHEMKAFAIRTNTLVVMQSQSSREKAGIGDLELNKDAAYGTVYFESYCDYLITIWQPLKRVYAEINNGVKCPIITAFKFCKIRHKKTGMDMIEEDVCYRLLFDPASERFREMTQEEEIAFDFFNKKAISKRKGDRNTDVIPYKSTIGVTSGKANNNSNPTTTG